VTPPVLWQYNFSNFNEKARWALDFKGIPHTRRSLLPAGPRAMLFSLRGTLPVLDLDGERVVDSTRIIEALERRYPEPPLTPRTRPSVTEPWGSRTSSMRRPATSFGASLSTSCATTRTT
jgi:glutathione S-transferase